MGARVSGMARRLLGARGLPRGRRAIFVALSLTLAAGIWLPCVHLLFAPDLSDYLRPVGVPPKARALAARHLKLWSDPKLRKKVLARMRASNAEWDFMGRTFFVLALGNMALREPAHQARYLSVMDRIIDETARLERRHGMFFFMMGYARRGPFVQQPPRSVFVDGEIALMMAARLLVDDGGGAHRYRDLLRRRVALITARMKRAPLRCTESYPDECWMFCNSVALAAIYIQDALLGTNHSRLIRQWLTAVKSKLVDPKTGMLVSSFALDGRVKDGPEGSSIFLAAHCLHVIDPAFAQDQYRRAREELGQRVLGFGYAREWPAGWAGHTDIDSGPIVPLLGASAGASGLALLGAASFGDTEFYGALVTSLELAAFPVERDGELRYSASNQVGDAVMLYAMVQGPAWARAKKLYKQRKGAAR